MPWKGKPRQDFLHLLYKQRQPGLSYIALAAWQGEVGMSVQNVFDARISSEAIGISQISNVLG